MANKNHILILPTQNRSELASEVSTVAPHFKSLAISRHDGFCRSFSGSDQATFNGKLNIFLEYTYYIFNCLFTMFVFKL